MRLKSFRTVIREMSDKKVESYFKKVNAIGPKDRKRSREVGWARAWKRVMPPSGWSRADIRGMVDG